MRFHNKELNFGKVIQPDVIELSTPPIEMNTILKTFASNERTTMVKRELAELEYEGHMEAIMRLYEDVSDGSERDDEIIEVIDSFSSVLNSLGVIEENTAYEALQAVKEESIRAESMKTEVVYLRSPLVRINTLAQEARIDDNISLSKRQLVDREYEIAKELLISYEADFESTQSLVEGFKDTMREITSLKEEVASGLVTESPLESVSVVQGLEKNTDLADVISLHSSK